MATRIEDARALLLGLDGTLVALHVGADPVSGEADVALYTDDGHGNGDLIVRVSLEDLLRAHRRFAESLGEAVD